MYNVGIIIITWVALRKQEGLIMEQSENLLIGIENVLRIANELVDEMADLYVMKEDYIRLKEQLFLN